MVCPKCSHEFCWECLGYYPNYTHFQQLECPTRIIVLYGQVFLLFTFILLRYIIAAIQFVYSLLTVLIACLALVTTHFAVEKDLVRVGGISIFSAIGILTLISILGSSPDYIQLIYLTVILLRGMEKGWIYFRRVILFKSVGLAGKSQDVPSNYPIK